MMAFDSSVATNDDFGKRTAPDAITFDRTLKAPIERMWNLLTTRQGLAIWMGEGAVDAHEGGEFTIQLTDEVTMRGRILVFDPPRRLVLTWREFENGIPTQHATTEDETSELSFTLEPIPTGTHLTLVHRLIRAGKQMNDFGAGWHAYLDSLQGNLEGASRIDPYARYGELRKVSNGGDLPSSIARRSGLRIFASVDLGASVLSSKTAMLSMPMGNSVKLTIPTNSS